MNYKLLKDCADIVGGQIMSRVATNGNNQEKSIDKKRVVIPKCILAEGTINVDDMPFEELREAVDDRKITKEGDIVIKLSTPYDSAIVTSESQGAIVPSFCAIIRNSSFNVNYLQAYLSTTECKEKLRNQVQGTVMSILSVGKVGAIEIPCPDDAIQREIGDQYRKTQNKLSIIKQIVELEAKRNNLVFKELCK